MSRASIAALIRRNADACEAARLPACRCHCGGEFHGRRHSDAWVERTAAYVEAQLTADREAERRQAQPDLFAS